jgi:ArsR family transcriptional regulator, arsenate/arsenite/antimonite-responsive transcriptional repressor
MKTRRRKCEPCSEEAVPCVVSTEGDEALAKLAWAIAHPARVRLVRLLIAKSACVCGELVELMPLSQSTVSQHLKILKEAGVVQGEIDGPKVCYCVNEDGLALLKELVAKL